MTEYREGTPRELFDLETKDLRQEADRERRLQDPQLRPLQEEVDFWLEAAEDPRNTAIEERLWQKVRLLEARIHAEEVARARLYRKDQLVRELHDLGRETPEETVRRLKRERPYGYHMTLEYLQAKAALQGNGRRRR